MVEQSQLLELAKLYGTPLYVYDSDQVVANYQSLYKFIAYDKLQVHYALKANYNIDLLKALRDAGAGLDTVSPGEVHLALALGFEREKIIFTANNLKDEEADDAIDYTLVIAKHRNGMRGNIPIKWKSEYTQFYEKGKDNLYTRNTSKVQKDVVLTPVENNDMDDIFKE